jgi:hypothetical protein
LRCQQLPRHWILVATQAVEAVEVRQLRAAKKAEQNLSCSHLHQTTSAVEAGVVEVLYDLIQVLLVVGRVEAEVEAVSLAVLSH